MRRPGLPLLELLLPLLEVLDADEFLLLRCCRGRCRGSRSLHLRIILLLLLLLLLLEVLLLLLLELLLLLLER